MKKSRSNGSQPLPSAAPLRSATSSNGSNINNIGGSSSGSNRHHSNNGTASSSAAATWSTSSAVLLGLPGALRTMPPREASASTFASTNGSSDDVVHPLQLPLALSHQPQQQQQQHRTSTMSVLSHASYSRADGSTTPLTISGSGTQVADTPFSLPESAVVRGFRALLSDSSKAMAILERVPAHQNDLSGLQWDLHVHQCNAQFCFELSGTTVASIGGGGIDRNDDENPVIGRRMRHDLNVSNDMIKHLLESLERAAQLPSGAQHLKGPGFGTFGIQPEVEFVLSLHVIENDVFTVAIDWGQEESMARHEEAMDKWRNLLFYAEIHIPTDTIRLSHSAAQLMRVTKLVWRRSVWRSFMHAEDKSGVVAAFSGAVSGLMGDRVEFRYRFRAPGETTYQSVYSRFCVMHRDKDGKALSMVGNFTDLSELESTSKALRASETRINTLVKVAEAVILGASADGTINYVSDFVEGLMGLPIGVVLNHHPREWAVRPNMEGTDVGFVRIWAEHFEQQRSINEIFPWIVFDQYSGLTKTLKHLQLKANPFFDTEGKMEGWIGVITDVTQVKLIEAKLAENNVQLQAALRTKENFLHNVSHEVRTPLNGINGLLTILSDSHLTDQQREWTETALSCCDSLLHITNDILDFSKIEAKRLTMCPEPFLVRECVGSAIDLLRNRAESKKLGLEFRIAEEVPRIIIEDVVRFKQILINLLSNAIKFTAEGQVTLSMKVNSFMADKCELETSVQDTGIGIANDKFHRLFCEFSQVDDSTSRSFGGTGLGLAISKNLVEMMGGKIWVESEPDKGTRFTFTIVSTFDSAPPLSPVQGAPSMLRKLFPSNTDIAAQWPMKLLVAEDNLVNIKIIERLLDKYGYKIKIVTNGREAVNAVLAGNKGDEPYECVLMDVQMPLLSGLDASMQIRTASLKWQPIIIAMTANAMTEDIEASVACGMNLFLAKPIKPIELAKVLEKAGEIVQAYRTAEEQNRLKRPELFGGTADPAEKLGILAGDSGAESSEASKTQALETKNGREGDGTNAAPPL